MKYDSDVWTSSSGKVEIRKSDVIEANPPQSHSFTGGWGYFDPFGAQIYTSISMKVRVKKEKEESYYILSGSDATSFWKWYDEPLYTKWLR